jgi:hypothetical protein
MKSEISSNLMIPALPPVYDASVPFRLNRELTLLLDFQLQPDVQTSKPSRSKQIALQTTLDRPSRFREFSRRRAPCEP